MDIWPTDPYPSPRSDPPSPSLKKQRRSRENMDVRILELCDVAPPQGCVQPCTLPLTFFDLMWYMTPVQVECLFLYHIPGCTTSAFHSTYLPSLKRSLSLALELFYPLAGRLVLDTAMDTPCIRVSGTAGDSVVLAVAESNDDLQELIASKGPKDNVRYRRLVPNLPLFKANQPVLALQVTLFPEHGIAVSLTADHAAMDGTSISHFMRTWASLCRSQGEQEPPFCDRSHVSGPISLQSPLFTKLKQTRSIVLGSKVPSQTDVVRASFQLTTAKLEQLRKWVADRASNDSGARFSSFTLAVALAWTCILRARGRTPKEMEWLVFPVDCRARLGHPQSTSYLGNAIAGCILESEGSRLVGEDGLVAAAVAIREKLKGFSFEVSRVQEKLEFMVDNSHTFQMMEPFAVAGGTRMRLYEADFGWGKPAKMEFVHNDNDKEMWLSEVKSDDGKDGVEIGLALPVCIMEEFAKVFNAALETCSR